MMTRLLKIGGWLLWSSVALVGIVLCSVLLLFYSPTGLDVILWGVQKALPELSVGSHTGSIVNGFSLSEVSYRNEQFQLTVDAQVLSIGLDPGCLFDSAICVDSLYASGVDIGLKTPAQEKNNSSGLKDQISIPFPVQISKLKLEDISVRVDDTLIVWKSLASGFRWERSDLRLSPTQWRGLNISLPISEPQSVSQAPSAMASINNKRGVIFKGVSLKDIRLPLNISVPNFSLADLAISQNEKKYQINHLDFGATTQNSNVDIVHFRVKTPEVDFSVDGNVTLQGNYPLKFNYFGHYLVAPFKGQSVQGQLTGSFAHLALDVQTNGPFKTNVKSTLSLTQDNLPFAINAKNTSGYWPLTGPDQYHFSRGTMQGQGTLASYTFLLSSVLEGEKTPDLSAFITGQGDLASVIVDRLELVSSDSRVDGQVQVDWSHGLFVSGTLNLDHFKPQLLVPDAPGVINGAVVANAEMDQDKNWSASISRLDLSGEIEGYSLLVKGNLTAHSAANKIGFEVVAPELVIEHGTNQVSISGRLTDSINLDVDIDIADLEKSLKQAQGQVTGHIQLRGQPEAPTADIKLSARQLKWQNLLQVEDFSANGSLVASLQSDADLSIALNSVTFQDQSLDSLLLHLQGSLDQHKVVFDLTSPEVSGQLVVNGGYDLLDSEWSGELFDAQFEHNEETLQLLQPAAIQAKFASSTVTVGSHCWGIDDAALCVTDNAQMSAKEVSASFKLESLNLDTMTRWIPNLPVSAEGLLQGDSTVYWFKGQDPDIETNLTVSKGKTTTKEDPSISVGWERIDIQVLLHAGKLSSKIKVDLTDNGSVMAQADVANLRVQEKELQGGVQISQMNLDFLQPLLGEKEYLKALINSNLTLSGDVLHPQVWGELTVNDISMRGESLPISVSSGGLTLDFKGYQTQLKGIVKTAEGDLQLEGDAQWQDLSAWTVNSRIFADGLNVNVPPMVKIKVVPDLSIHLVPGRASIEGQLAVPSGFIEVENLPKTAITVSKDQVIVDAAGEPVQDKTLPLNINTDIAVKIGDELRLVAFGLKGKLSGLLKIVQKDNSPFITGDVNILDGTYRSLGQDLIIQQGQVLFNGPVSKPYVAISAIRNPDNIEDDVTAGLKVSGPADNPQVTVFSTPAMAQANALSYLVRGRSLASDGGDNAMTSTLIGLSLAQSGQIVGDLGQAVGVQDLQLDTTGSGDDSQVTVSGYVLPGLQVKYGVGIFNSVGEFTLRYRLIKNLYVEAVSGLDSAVDLIYQFEFN